MTCATGETAVVVVVHRRAQSLRTSGTQWYSTHPTPPVVVATMSGLASRQSSQFCPHTHHDDHCFCSVPVKNKSGQVEQRELLAGINGFARPGTLTALMGASGAGKSAWRGTACCVVLRLCAAWLRPCFLFRSLRCMHVVPTTCVIHHHSCAHGAVWCACFPPVRLQVPSWT